MNILNGDSLSLSGTYILKVTTSSTTNPSLNVVQSVGFTIDKTVPILSNVTTTANQLNRLTADSNEISDLYLVLKSVNVTGINSLNGSEYNNNWRKASVYNVGYVATFYARDLILGTYVIYAVDKAGNISAASADIMVGEPTVQQALADVNERIWLGANDIFTRISVPVLGITGLNNQLINSYYNALKAQYITGGNLTQSTIQNVINSVNAS